MPFRQRVTVFAGSQSQISSKKEPIVDQFKTNFKIGLFFGQKCHFVNDLSTFGGYTVDINKHRQRAWRNRDPMQEGRKCGRGLHTSGLFYY
jgi:hypothetical protein